MLVGLLHAARRLPVWLIFDVGQGMNRRSPVLFCGIVIAVLIQGCASKHTRLLERIKQPRAFHAEVSGQSRLFSSIGFLALDDSLQGRLALAFDDAGRFDIAKFRASVPDAEVGAQGEYYHFKQPSGTWKDAWIGNGRVVALDPALDEIVVRFMAALRQGSDRVPPISLPTVAR